MDRKEAAKLIGKIVSVRMFAGQTIVAQLVRVVGSRVVIVRGQNAPGDFSMSQADIEQITFHQETW